jgi:isopenicillin N synthase-like dioxygenase
MLTSLPILDPSELDAGPERAAAFRDELRRVTHDVGFFYLVGHGVDPQLTAELLSVSRRFFELDPVDKLAIENTRSAQFRGYTRVGTELSALALRLLRTWAVALGSPEDVFDEAFSDHPFSLLKIVRYPGRPETEAKQGVGARLDLDPALRAEARGVSADPTDSPILETYGENVLRYRLRAHPDVAAIHHADLLRARDSSK